MKHSSKQPLRSQVDWTHLHTYSIPSTCYKFHMEYPPLPPKSEQTEQNAIITPSANFHEQARSQTQQPACFFPNLSPPQNSNPLPHPSNPQRQIRQNHQPSIQARGIAFGDFGSCCFGHAGSSAWSSIMARARDGRVLAAEQRPLAHLLAHHVPAEKAARAANPVTAAVRSTYSYGGWWQRWAAQLEDVISVYVPSLPPYSTW